MSNIAIRYAVASKMPKDLTPDKPAVKNARIHRFSGNQTLCGRTIPADDPRWKLDVHGDVNTVNCHRCLVATPKNTNKPVDSANKPVAAPKKKKKAAASKATPEPKYSNLEKEELPE